MGIFNKDPEFKTTIKTRTEKRVEGKNFKVYHSRTGDDIVIESGTGYITQFLFLGPIQLKELKDILNKWEELP